MRKQSKSAMLTAGGLTLLLAACGGAGSNGNSDTTTLRIGHISHNEGDYELTLQALDDALQEATDGRVEIETYPDGQLGGDVEMLEQVQSGNTEGGVLNSGAVASVVPAIGALELPYLFDNLDHARASIDGAVGELLTEEAAEEDLVLLGIWEVGFKNITNNVRPIQSAEDAAGIHLRVIENPIAISTYTALDMQTTPLPYPEVYTALQQGLVDGFEGPYNSFISGGLEEVQDYVSEVQMVYSTAAFVISQDAFDSLTEDDQQTLRDLSAEHVAVQREHSVERMARDRQATVDAGVEILETEDLDIESFRDATETVREEEGAQFQDIMDAVE